MRPRSGAALRDISNSCQDVERLIENVSNADLAVNRDLMHTIERYLEIIGEAIRRLRDDDPDVFQEIELGQEFIALRNVIAHGYDRINSAVILQSCQLELPKLLACVTRMLDSKQ